MNMRNVVLFSMLLPTLVTAQTAQTPVVGPKLEAVSPAECIKAANDWRNAQMRPLSQALSSKQIDTDAYMAGYTNLSKETQRIARECGDRFSLERAASADLPGMIQLYAFVGDTVRSVRAIEKALAAKDLSQRMQGQVLSMAMTQEVTRASSVFGILEGAERYVRLIDALPDSLADIRLTAHQSMLGRYEYLDVADGLLHHSQAVLANARVMGKKDYMANAYLSLARSFADRLMPDSALHILDNAEKELAGTARVAETFKDFRARYALIGTPAARITGDWFINSNGTLEGTQPGNGKVTFIEFTAHWCGPCKNSYPGVGQLTKRFEGKPFQGVMVTSLYGYVGDKKNLDAEQEVAADRIYFAEHHVPFGVAINKPVKDAAGRTSGMPAVDGAYRVGGIPQIMIVDQKGIIRQIVTGWDHGNTERMGKYIDGLLKAGS
jgi:hypothetical protein